MIRFSSRHRLSRRSSALFARAVREAKRYLLIFVYLWTLFGLFALHASILLPGEGFFYGQGLAIVNALVLAKVIFLAENLHVGENFEDRPLAYPILFKSATFAVILICFRLIENIITGSLHGKTIFESESAIGSGSWEDILSVGIIVFVVLIPFFAFREISRVIGEHELRELLFLHRLKMRAEFPQRRKTKL